MAQISYAYVVCAECSAELDRIEYDDQPAAAVTTIANTLGVELAEAEKLVKRNNPGAEKTSRQNAEELAKAIAKGDVDGYPTLTCPADPGHVGQVVADSTTRPTPIVSTRLARQDAAE